MLARMGLVSYEITDDSLDEDDLEEGELSDSDDDDHNGQVDNGSIDKFQYQCNGQQSPPEITQITSDANCIICGSDQIKYKCPGCMLRTCSLPCIKDHKIRFTCTGERDRLKFVKIDSYGDNQFLDGNDYCC